MPALNDDNDGDGDYCDDDCCTRDYVADAHDNNLALHNRIKRR